MEEQNKIVTVVELSTQQAQTELVKLNATVSNSTKTLEERIEAKNKAIEIQNALSKKTITALENERRTLEGRGATERELQTIFQKLNSTKLEALKVSEKSRVEIDKLTAAQDKQIQKTEQEANSVKSLRVQLRDAVIDQGKLAQQYGETSTEAIKAAKAVAEIKDQIQFNADLVSSFDPDQKFKALGAATEIAGTGIQGVTAGMALFGDVGEDTEKTLLKVQAAMSFSQALQQLSGLGDQYKIFKSTIVGAYLAITTAKTADTIATEANIVVENQSTASKIKSTIVTGALTVATSIAAAAQWVWNAAILANPIVALVVAIAAAAAGIYFFTKMLMDSSEANEQTAVGTEKLAKSLDKESITLYKTGEAVREKNKQTLAMAKANGESTESIRKLEKKLIDEQIATDKASAITARNTFIQERNNLAKLEAAGASDEVIEARKKEVEVAYQIFQRENKQLDASYKERAQLVKDQEVQIATEKTEARKKAAEDSKKSDEDSKKKSEEARKKKKADDEKAAKEELDRLKRQKAAEIALAETEIAKTKAKNPKADTLDAEKSVLKQKEELELMSANLLATEKLAIQEKYNLSSLELDLKQIEDKKKITDEQYKIQQEKKVMDLELKQAEDQIDFESHQRTILEKTAFDIAQVEEKSRLELSNLLLTEAEKLRIKQDTENQIAYLNKLGTVANKTAVDQQASDGIDALAESFGIAKEVAVAKMIIAAPEAIGNSFKNASAAYIPPMSIIMGALGAAATVVPIVKGLSDIKKTRFPGKSKKGGGSGGGAISSPSASSGVASTAIGNLSANNAARLGIDPSIKGAATADAANNIAGSTKGQVVFSEGKYSDFKNQVQFKEQKTSI